MSCELQHVRLAAGRFILPAVPILQGARAREQSPGLDFCSTFYQEKVEEL
jgi:hypothetical protein